MQMISDSESDPFCDSGSSYVPGSSEDGSTSLEDMFISQKEPEIQTSEIQNVSSRNQKRGTRRKYRDETKWKRNVRKKQRNSGQEYTNAKGKVIESKKFDSSDCSCTRECHRLVVLDHREKLFSAFYSLANFDLQTSYLCGRIKLSKKVKHNEKSESLHKDVLTTRLVLKVSDGRLSRALKGLQDNGVPSTDKRGKKAPYNKTSPAKVEETKNPNKQYLAPTLNISILYNLYKNEHENFVSKRVFTEVFKKNFNLSFHAPISDSCKTCDTLEQKIKDTADGDERRRLEIEREVHL
nr:unnamed protein product [Callosobruchus analis]